MRRLTRIRDSERSIVGSAWFADTSMSVFRWVAAVVFFFELPTPIFWLVVHPLIRYWRQKMRVAYLTATLTAWGLVTVFLILFRRVIFTRAQRSALQIGFGLLLIAAGIRLFTRAKQDLGTSRFVGKTEIQGGGEVIDTGIYSRIRNPRYVGMILSVAGACLLATTPLMWAIAAGWLALVLLVIAFEERELRARLGAPYIEYCRRVPRFIPYRAPVRTK